MAEIPVFPAEKFEQEISARVLQQSVAVEWAAQVRTASEDIHDMLCQLLEREQEYILLKNREMQEIFNCMADFLKALRDQDEPERQGRWQFTDSVLIIPESLRGASPTMKIHVYPGHMHAGSPEALNSHRGMSVEDLRKSLVRQLGQTELTWGTLDGCRLSADPVMEFSSSCNSIVAGADRAQEKVVRVMQEISDAVILTGYFRRTGKEDV
jgi:hypothetical protein